MDFFKLEIDENYSMRLEYISKHSDTIFSKKSIKTHCVLEVQPWSLARQDGS